jgi:hypothetical protein
LTKRKRRGGGEEGENQTLAVHHLMLSNMPDDLTFVMERPLTMLAVTHAVISFVRYYLSTHHITFKPHFWLAY